MRLLRRLCCQAHPEEIAVVRRRQHHPLPVVLRLLRDPPLPLPARLDDVKTTTRPTRHLPTRRPMYRQRRLQVLEVPLPTNVRVPFWCRENLSRTAQIA